MQGLFGAACNASLIPIVLCAESVPVFTRLGHRHRPSLGPDSVDSSNVSVWV